MALWAYRCYNISKAFCVTHLVLGNSPLFSFDQIALKRSRTRDYDHSYRNKSAQPTLKRLYQRHQPMPTGGKKGVGSGSIEVSVISGLQSVPLGGRVPSPNRHINIPAAFSLAVGDQLWVQYNDGEIDSISKRYLSFYNWQQIIVQNPYQPSFVGWNIFSPIAFGLSSYMGWISL